MQPAYQQFFVITLQETETLIENHFAHIRKIQITIHYDIISGLITDNYKLFEIRLYKKLY